MNAPRRHHYIAQFYLRRWRCADGRICEFSKPYKETVKPRRVYTKQTAFVDRLYTLRHFPEHLQEQVEERFFKRADQLASDALQQLEDRSKSSEWDAERRVAWCRFIIALELRTPEDLEGMRADWLRRYYTPDPSLEEQYQSNWMEGEPETFEEYLRQTSNEDLEAGFFEALMSTIESERLQEAISSMFWGTIDLLSTDLELLTSDRPVVRTTLLTGSSSHIVLPIAPKRLFVAAVSQEVRKSIFGVNQKQLVRDVNLAVVQQANKFVYARRDKPLRFIQKHLSGNPRPRLYELLSQESSNAHIQE